MSLPDRLYEVLLPRIIADVLFHAVLPQVFDFHFPDLQQESLSMLLPGFDMNGDMDFFSWEQ